jgi:hypothetical protein
VVNLLVIQETPIRQDAYGRYSLNDLHKAAMANGIATESQRPGEFLKSDSIQNFVAALDADAVVSKKGGSCQGTWACKDLLLKYATWLSSDVEKLIYQKVNDLDAIVEAINNFEVPHDCPDLYVYAIRNTTTGNIKLGISRDPKERMRQLQTGNDCKLELVAYRKADNRFKDEASIHLQVSQHHIHGEWFDKGVNGLLIDHGLEGQSVQ